MSIPSVVESGRRLIGKTFLDLGLIGRRALAPDSSGGQVSTWVDDPAPVECRFGVLVDPIPENTVESVYGPATARILFPLGTEYAEGDRVTNMASGTQWLIVGDKTPESNLAVVMTALVRTVE